MRKILITGANGFIGTSLINEISRENNIEIIAMVSSPQSDISGIAECQNTRIVYCRLENIEKLAELVPDRDIEACIHLAWAGTSGDARSDYNIQLDNAKYSMKLVDTAADMNIPRFVGVGTLAEKDVMNYHLLDESTPNAVSLYGVAKLTAHMMTKTQCNVRHIEHIWCCLSNTYGVGNTTGNFVNFASKVMLEGKRAAFTPGEQMYDFVYITDTVRALWAAACNGRNNCEYYLGSSSPRQLKEYIRIIRDTIDPSIELHLGEIPFNGQSLDAKEYDCTKLKKDTGFSAKISFEQGIKDTIEWLRSCY